MRTACLLALALCGCLDTRWHGVDLALTFDPGCGVPGGLDGVKRLRLETLGPGFQPEPEEVSVPAPGESADYRLAAGSGRFLRVSGLDASGQVVSRGQTAPEDVPSASTGAPREVRVAMLPLDVWVAPPATGGCLRLLTPRTEQSSLVMPDGRVLISGGRSRDSGGGWTAVSSTEWLPAGAAAPQDGAPVAFDDRAQGNTLALGAARQPSLLLSHGFLAFSGGVRTFQPAPASSSIQLLCQLEDGQCGLLSDMHQASRAGHQLVEVGDSVWSVGGETVSGAQVTPVATVEVLDEATNAMHVLTGLDGTDAVPARARSGDLWLVGGARADRVDATGAVLEHRVLLEVRRSPEVVPLGDDALLVLGGVDASGAPVDGSERVEPGAVSMGPALPAASGACATPLNDGSALVAGGLSSGATVRDAVRVFPDGHAEALAPLPALRSGASCRTRPDGSVVLAGGVDGTRAVAADVFVFAPR